MLLSNVIALLIASTLVQIVYSLPVSQNHRFAIYTPYWQQGSQARLTQEFNQKRLSCLTEECDLTSNQLPPQYRNDLANSIPVIKPAKRNKNMYKTGWTMGGMPFSVLYMNPKPQISLRSPISKSLRSLPQTYDSEELLEKEPPPGLGPDTGYDNYIQGVQAQALTSGAESAVPTAMPTRRQYSIIPQLFVSYGWGPLGK